jgi:hypothetical protein
MLSRRAALAFLASAPFAARVVARAAAVNEYAFPMGDEPTSEGAAHRAWMDAKGYDE